MQARKTRGFVPLSVATIGSLRTTYKKNQLTIPKVKKVWLEVVTSVFKEKNLILDEDLPKLVPKRIIRKNYFLHDLEISDQQQDVGLSVEVPAHTKQIFQNNIEEVVKMLQTKLRSNEIIKVIYLRIIS